MRDWFLKDLKLFFFNFTEFTLKNMSSKEVVDDTGSDGPSESKRRKITDGKSVCEPEPSVEKPAENSEVTETRLSNKKEQEELSKQNVSNVGQDLTVSSASTTDKTPGVHTDVVAEHYNAIPERGLSHRNQSRIFFMRNFNNWIKSMLINEYLVKIKDSLSHGTPIKVLDMCCGKGGDLYKWKQGAITHLICTDIADVSVQQCESRFESLPQAECMMRNASESLKPGGYFIATIPNANDLVYQWKQAEGNKFGNSVYNVEFLCDKEKIPLFGAKYNFHLEDVVDCPEFLINVTVLKKLAAKFGLEFISFERFNEFYARCKGDGKSLLAKMQAMESYPPYHEPELKGNNPEDYQHAIQYTQNKPDHRKIGTLTLSEWEATSLYAVVAFKKMKTSWSSEGKPEYSKA
ncbi:Similar to Rnmt: mRNA cap guanine-N7 methyltransferase (Drosophila melanogaster) [Cotesia congregata]|uniref:mRNA cap guanine-N(7) methyltransferase n=1 Tax=Cotesia congregata TaxID=51543 RepID=A0A8J2HLF0_COTCN|nr:Similar to Rnmt: mRNA cap guanine-N7 methyltransferase (Drosophila melanogaster) [Cotesia congregata]